MPVTVSFASDNPETIWNRLAARLGREPTDAEAAEAVLRVLRGEPALAASLTLAEEPVGTDQADLIP